MSSQRSEHCITTVIYKRNASIAVRDDEWSGFFLLFVLRGEPERLLDEGLPLCMFLFTNAYKIHAL